MKKEFTFEGKKYKVEGNKAVEIDNNQEQDERATKKFSASQSKSNKRDMGNSAPADLKELKTLKDLKEEPEELYIDGVKTHNPKGNINTERDLSFCKTAVGTYITWKNNLTEEDLK